MPIIFFFGSISFFFVLVPYMTRSNRIEKMDKECTLILSMG